MERPCSKHHCLKCFYSTPEPVDNDGFDVTKDTGRGATDDNATNRPGVYRGKFQ